MRKYVLLTLMCFASSTGAFASNEVTNEIIISEEIAPNCFVYLDMYDNTGSIVQITFEITASAEDDCHAQARDLINLLINAGYVLISEDIQFI